MKKTFRAWGIEGMKTGRLVVDHCDPIRCGIHPTKADAQEEIEMWRLVGFRPVRIRVTIEKVEKGAKP